MIVVGICGSSGSGKSTVCRLLWENGAVVFDCDQIYHELVSKPSECLQALANEFGKHIIRDNMLNRAVLREIVFSDTTKHQKLNQISHFYVKDELKKHLNAEREKNTSLVLIDAPMLFEANLQTWCDSVIAVVCDFDVQVKRIVARDAISEKEAIRRLSKQVQNDELIRRSTYVIHNNDGEASLREQCNQLYKTIMKGQKF